jgi:hypothetical protein
MVQAGFGGLFHLKPLVELREGVVTTLTRIRTWSRALSALVERTQSLAPFERLAVMHTQNENAAQDLLARICSGVECPSTPLVVPATTAIAWGAGWYRRCAQSTPLTTPSGIPASCSLVLFASCVVYNPLSVRPTSRF